MQVYEYTSDVLQHAGWGAVRDLTAPVLQCVLLELYTDASGGSAAQQPSEASGKKRKRQKAQQQQQQADLAALAKGAPAPGSSQVLRSEMLKSGKCCDCCECGSGSRRTMLLQHQPE